MLEVVYVIAKRSLNPDSGTQGTVRISPKWKRTAALYVHFSQPWSHLCDYSTQAEEDMFLYESRGIPIPQRERRNGFQLGKQWMDINVAMWKEGIAEGTSLRREFYEDPNYPHWWLDKVLRE